MIGLPAFILELTPGQWVNVRGRKGFEVARVVGIKGNAITLDGGPGTEEFGMSRQRAAHILSECRECAEANT